MKAFLILGAAALVPLGGCAWFDGDDDDDDRRSRETETRRDTGRASGTVIDPVSGESVKTDTMFQTEWQGRVYYFNSRDNMDRFTRNPSAYVTPEGRPRRDVEGVK